MSILISKGYDFMKYDLILKNGRIIDGTGKPIFKADIGIMDGKIEQIKIKIDSEAEKIIDVNDLVISPGFIDVHSHSDINIILENSLSSKIRQGITTEVIGQCGFSAAPISEEGFETFKRDLDVFLPPRAELKITWRTFAEYLEEVERVKISLNIVPLVGFGTIRIAGGPGYENRDPTLEEIGSMKQFVEEAMRAGAFGMSSGLVYSPQVYAKTAEVIEVARTVAQFDGLYFSHIRDEGAKVVEAVKEFIEIVEKSGCKGGQIAHFKVAGSSYWGMSKETLKLVEEANDKNLDIKCDQYPYNRGMTSLITILPPWVHEGGIEKILERLADENEREKIRKDFEEDISEHAENWFKIQGADKVFIASVKTDKWKDIEGKNIAEITKLRNKTDDIETVLDILLEEEGAVEVTLESMGEEDIKRIMSNKNIMFGTDGEGVSPTGITSHGKPHPRFYGSFPRVLRKYVREEKLLSLEEAIRKMTSFPAQRLGIDDRGIIKEGMWADLVIFDDKTVTDMGTYENPHQYPQGIEHVLVNGIVVVENNVQNRELPGKVLRYQS
ncbi:MAG: D-aminoacylase [Candidatus Heimdallarchaeota archaeon]|nr:D-aminoacylase [Candidatus Heimdallarchaeota archaeon]MCK4955792.1 D-aminoacylase [Candidatus Heimdallarchaeota archaeon]